MFGALRLQHPPSPLSHSLSLSLCSVAQKRNQQNMNVIPVWQLGITGKDVVVSILDDGMPCEMSRKP